MGKSTKVYECRTCLKDGKPLEFTHVGCGCNAKCPICGKGGDKHIKRVR